MPDNSAHSDMLLPFIVAAVVKIAEDHVQSPLIRIAASSGRYCKTHIRGQLAPPPTFDSSPLESSSPDSLVESNNYCLARGTNDRGRPRPAVVSSLVARCGEWRRYACEN